MQKINSFAHHFLVAMPALLDFNFTKSVVYIHEHNNKGAMGVIVNKVSQINLGSVLENLNIQTTNTKITETPVLMGGPIGQEQGFILFENKEAKKEKAFDLNVSASKDVLHNIAQGKGPDSFLITLGYAGWGAGQLESELVRNDWLVVPYDPRILFETDLDKRWQAAAALIGIDLKRLSGHVGHA